MEVEKIFEKGGSLPLRVSPCRAVILMLSLLSIVSGEICTSVPFENYQRCMDEHPCECSNCDYNPTDKDPIITIEHPETCQDVVRAVCPLIKCCSPCVEETLAFYNCAAQAISLHFTGGSCPVNLDTCLGFAYDDASCGDENPNPAPAGAPTDSEDINEATCNAKANNYEMCLQNKCGDAIMAKSSGTCGVSSCDVVNPCCCPACEAERAEVAECLECSSTEACVVEVGGSGSPSDESIEVSKSVSQSSASAFRVVWTPLLVGTAGIIYAIVL